MEKKCDYKHKDIRMYIRNRMNREEETKFQQHLQNCEECRKELALLRRMIHSMGEKKRRTISFRIWVIAASLACLIIGEGIYYYSTKGEDNSVPSSGNILRMHPTEQHLQKDSIPIRDSISTDTVQIQTKE